MVCFETALYSFTGTFSSPKLIEPLQIALAIAHHVRSTLPSRRTHRSFDVRGYPCNAGARSRGALRCVTAVRAILERRLRATSSRMRRRRYGRFVTVSRFLKDFCFGGATGGARGVAGAGVYGRCGRQERARCAGVARRSRLSGARPHADGGSSSDWAARRLSTAGLRRGRSTGSGEADAVRADRPDGAPESHRGGRGRGAGCDEVALRRRRVGDVMPAADERAGGGAAADGAPVTRSFRLKMIERDRGVRRRRSSSRRRLHPDPTPRSPSAAATRPWACAVGIVAPT